MSHHQPTAPLTVELVNDAVVLTLSRLRAHHMGMVVNGVQGNETWLGEAALAMLTAAERPGMRSAELYHRGAWLDASARISRELLRASGMMGVAQDIADHVLQFSRSSSVSILVLSTDDPAHLEVRVAAGAGAAALIDGTVLTAGSLAGAAIDNDRGQLQTTADRDALEVTPGSSALSRPVMAVPVHVGGRPSGAIVARREPGQTGFDTEDLVMVEEFARQISLLLELASRRAEQGWRQERTERNRSERILFDNLLQHLFAVGMRVQSAQAALRLGEDSLAGPQTHQHLTHAVDDLNSLIREIRAAMKVPDQQAVPTPPQMTATTGAAAASPFSVPAPHTVKPPAREAEVAASLVRTAALHAAERAETATETAAHRAAEAATTARDERSAAVQMAAEAVAARVAAAAAAVKDEADVAALTVAQAAFDAALLIASTVEPGSERDAALTATLVATAVSGIAIKTAAVTAAARAEVAQEAATAAAAAAVAAADAAKIVDLEVLYAAEAVRAVATQTASVLAEQTEAEATAITLTHG